MSMKFAKYLRRIFAAALVLSFSVGLVPMQPAADTASSVGITAKAEENEKLLYDFDRTSGVLTIKSGTYNNPSLELESYYDGDPENEPATTYNVKKIQTEENVTFKGSCYALFSYLGALESVDLSNVDASEATSFVYMFESDSKLETITFGDKFTTENCTDFGGMFYQCIALKKLDLSSFTIGSEINTWNMLSECSSLVKLTLPAGLTITDDMYLENANIFYNGWAKSDDPDTIITDDSSTVQSLAGPGEFIRVKKELNFSYDPATYTLTLEKGSFTGEEIKSLRDALNTSDYYYDPRVRSIVIKSGVKITGDCSYLFSHYTNYGGIDLTIESGVEFSELTSVNSMFQYAQGTVDLSNFDLSGIDSLDSMFEECSIEKLNLSSFDTSNVTSMRSLFSNCSSEVVSGDKFDTSKVTDMSCMFSNFSGTFDYTKLNTSNVEDMSSMFAGCGSTVIDLSRFDTSKVTEMHCMFNGSSVKDLDLSGFVLNDEIDYYDLQEMCSYCSNLESIKFPKTENGFKPKSLSAFFRYCTSLKTIDLSGIDCSELTSMMSLFENCTALESVNFGSIDTSELENSSSMFKGCTSLKTMDISNLNVKKSDEFSEMFRGCTALESVKLPDMSLAGTEQEYSYSTIRMSSMFDGCTSLTSVNWSNLAVTKKISNISQMFKNCSSLKEANLSYMNPEFDSYFYMYEIFKGCTALEKVSLCPVPAGFNNSSNDYNYNNMFEGADNIKQLTVKSQMNFKDVHKLKNVDYTYTGWYYDENTNAYSGSGTYAVFNAYPSRTYIRKKVSYPDSTIKGASLTLEGQIGLNFYMAFPESVTADSDAYVVISGPKGDKKLKISDADFNKDTGYKFTYTLAAKQIHDKLKISVYDGSGNKLTLDKINYTGIFEAVEGNEYSYSVSDYISSVKSSSSSSSKLLALVKALEAYGSYAQLYFGYNTDTVSTYLLTSVSSVTADTVKDKKFRTYTDLPEGLTLTGYSLILDSETTFKIYFEVEDESKLEFFSWNKDYYKKLSDNKYCAVYENISAKDLDNSIDFYFKYNDSYVNVYACPLSYVYSAIAQFGSDSAKNNLCNTMRALKLYNDAANNYFSN